MKTASFLSMTILNLLLVALFLPQNKVMCDSTDDNNLKQVKPTTEKLDKIILTLKEYRQGTLLVDRSDYYSVCNSNIEKLFRELKKYQKENDKTSLSDEEKTYVIVKALDSQALFTMNCHKSATYASYLKIATKSKVKKCAYFKKQFYKDAFILNGKVDPEKPTGFFSFMKPKDYQKHLMDTYYIINSDWKGCEFN